MGSADGLEQDLIEDDLFESSRTVQAGPLHGVNPLRGAISLARLSVGTLQALNIFRALRPQSVFLTGGWVGLPVAVAATFFRVPITIFVPDIEPGLTLKVLGRFAKHITATTADTSNYYRKTVTETGYPLRTDLMAATRAAGQQRFKLQPDVPTLLIFGGSRGARSINQAVLATVADLLQNLDLQILHVSGQLDWPTVQTTYDGLPEAIRQRYQIFEYLHDIGLAMAAADLVLSRAGASILGEFPYFHLPAILVPYPYAWRYQKVNADWLVERGAAQRLDDEKLNDELVPTVQALITDPERLNNMAQAAAALARSDGADNIAAVILST